MTLANDFGVRFKVPPKRNEPGSKLSSMDSLSLSSLINYERNKKAPLGKPAEFFFIKKTKKQYKYITFNNINTVQIQLVHEEMLS